MKNIKNALMHWNPTKLFKVLDVSNTLLGLAALLCVASWFLDRELPVRNIGRLKVGENNVVRAGAVYPAEISYEMVRGKVDCNAAIDLSLFDDTGRLLPGGVHSFHTAAAFAESAKKSPGLFTFYLDVPTTTATGDITLAGAVRYSCGNNVLQYIMPLTLEYKTTFKVVK